MLGGRGSGRAGLSLTMMEGRKKAGRPVLGEGKDCLESKRRGEEKVEIVQLVGWAVVNMCGKKTSFVNFCVV